jgi:uncharacterized repeat protein (TIGR01451 family)
MRTRLITPFLFSTAVSFSIFLSLLYAQGSQLLHQIASFSTIQKCADSQDNIYGIGNIFTNVTIGATPVTCHGYSNGVVYKMDTLGNFLWVRNLQDPVSQIPGVRMSLSSIIYTSQNEILICGYFNDTVHINNVFYQAPSNSARGFLVKLDALTGNFISVDVASAQFGSSLSLLRNDAQGNILLAGTSLGQVQFSNFSLGGSGTGSFLAKLTASGNLIWQVPIDNGLFWGALFNSIHADVNNDILIALDTRNAPNVIIGSNTINLPFQHGLNHYFAIVKIDQNGNFMWLNQVDGLCNLYINESEANGDFYVHGFMDSMVVYQNTTFTSLLNSNDMFMARMNSNGNIIWHKLFGSSRDDEIRYLEKDRNGNLIFCGYFSNGFKVNNTSLIATIGKITAMMGSIDPTGNWKWLTQADLNTVSTFTRLVHVTSGNNMIGFLSYSNWQGGPTPMPVRFWGVSAPGAGGGGNIYFLENNRNYMTGRTFIDSNNNGSLDVGEAAAPYVRVDLALGSAFTFSDAAGNFVMPTPNGNHSLQVNSPPYNYAVNTNPMPSAQFLIGGELDTANHIGLLGPTGLNDLSIQIIPLTRARYYRPHAYEIIYRNEGTSVQNATISFTIPQLVNFIGSTPSANSVNNFTYTYSVLNLQPLQSGSIQFLIDFTNLVYLPTDTIFTYASITSALNDAFPQNNIHEDTSLIWTPYDPNYKTVSNTHLNPAELAANPWLHYTIHFQNLGNDTAFHVVIQDSLSDNLMLSTLQLEESSDPVELTINSMGKATFTFYNIQLPDSGTDYVGSCGYVKYKVKPKTSLVPDDVISNFADIYFDYNDPIRTDTAITYITWPVSMQASLSSSQLHAYPNPIRNGVLYLEWDKISSQSFVEIYAASGQIIQRHVLSEQPGFHKISIQNLGLPTGVYFCSLKDQDSVHHFRIMITPEE